MKHCSGCGYENLNEQILCRHCGKEFEDFDLDGVDRENICTDSSNDWARHWEYEWITSYSGDNVLKDSVKFIVESLLCFYGVYLGFVLTGFGISSPCLYISLW